MRTRIIGSLALVFTSAAVAAGQQMPQQAAGPHHNMSPWVVTVIHAVNTDKMLEHYRSHPNVQVGVRGTPPAQTIVVTTGLVVDTQGHVVTRLVALDPSDNDPKLTVATNDGARLHASLVGVDCATGFAVIKVDSLSARPPDWVGQSRVSDGFSVKILSMSLVRVTPPAERQVKEIRVTPVITINDGTVETGSLYSKLRGTYTLRAQWLLSRNDSSVVEAPDGSVVGIAQFAGVNRAYLYPAEYIRNGIVTRVLQKNGSVPSGWLGVSVDVKAATPTTGRGVLVTKVQPDSPAAKCGLQANDLIVGLDDIDVKGPGELSAVLSSSPAGRKFKLRAMRQTQPVQVEVELGEKVCEVPRLVSLDELMDETPEERLRKIEQARVELEITLNSFQQVQGAWQQREEALAEVRIEMDKLDKERREVEGQLKRDDNNSSAVYAFPALFTALEIREQMGNYFGIEGPALLVYEVKDGGAAQRAGLQSGDVIVGIQTTRVAPARLRQMLLRQRGDVLLNIVRKSGSGRVSTPVRLAWAQPPEDR